MTYVQGGVAEWFGRWAHDFQILRSWVRFPDRSRCSCLEQATWKPCKLRLPMRWVVEALFRASKWTRVHMQWGCARLCCRDVSKEPWPKRNEWEIGTSTTVGIFHFIYHYDCWGCTSVRSQISSTKFYFSWIRFAFFLHRQRTCESKRLGLRKQSTGNLSYSGLCVCMVTSKQ